MPCFRVMEEERGKITRIERVYARNKEGAIRKVAKILVDEGAVDDLEGAIWLIREDWLVKRC